MTSYTDPKTDSMDVALDLRHLGVGLRDRQDFFRVWDTLLAPALVGRQVTSGHWIELPSPKGLWKMLVLYPLGAIHVGHDTTLNVIDLGRNPDVRHACKACREQSAVVFGAFFCPQCREEGRPDRLCESHARFLENRYTAYCDADLPRCRCREGCDEPSTFECDRCHRPFSDRWKRRHPNDPLTLLCSFCYAFQFETCAECEREGRKRLGKSRCAFPTGTADERHDKRLCTLRHARQWQVWGPHWRGVSLCEAHHHGLASAAPLDLLWMLVTAKAPTAFLKERAKDVYRLKQIVGHVRRQEFTWADMESALRQLRAKAEELPGLRPAKDTIDDLLIRLKREEASRPELEAQLLAKVRAFYRPHLPVDPSGAILALEIKRVFGRPGEGQSYRIAIKAGKDYYGRSLKGRLIGPRGSLVNQLTDALNLRGVDIEE